MYKISPEGFTRARRAKQKTVRQAVGFWLMVSGENVVFYLAYLVFSAIGVEAQ